MAKKTCNTCEEVKVVEDFYAKAGRSGTSAYSHICKVCEKLKRKQAYKVAPTKARNKEYYSANKEAIQARRKEVRNTELSSRVSACKAQAKRRSFLSDMAFDLTTEYLIDLYYKQSALCALSGLPLAIAGGAQFKGDVMSLDRIDSEGGYTEVNVQWVRLEYNILKRDHSSADLLTMCQNVIRTMQ